MFPKLIVYSHNSVIFVYINTNPNPRPTVYGYMEVLDNTAVGTWSFWNFSLSQSKWHRARGINGMKAFEDIPSVEFMYLVFIRVQGESYRRRLGSLLLCLCDVFRALINSLVCS